MTETINTEEFSRDGYEIIEDYKEYCDGDNIVIIGKDYHITGEFNALSIVQKILDYSYEKEEYGFSSEERLAECYVYFDAWTMDDASVYEYFSADFVDNFFWAIRALDHQRNRKIKNIGLLRKEKTQQLRTELESASTKVERKKICNKYF